MTTNSVRDVLAPLLSQYHRRFSVLDLGSGGGEISQGIELDYDAAVFTLDRECDALLKCEITAHGLEQLSSREHFDVVIAFNFLHHFWDWKWERATLAVLGMGVHVFIQLPPRGTEHVAGEEIIDGLHDMIGPPPIDSIWYPSFNHHRPIWLIYNPPVRPGLSTGRPWTITANYDRITGTRAGHTREWIPGMNLWNMLGLGADREWLVSMIKSLPLPEDEHGDILPWNIIWDGRQLHLIDGKDEPLGHRVRSDVDGRAETVRMLTDEENTEWDVTRGEGLTQVKP